MGFVLAVYFPFLKMDFVYRNVKLGQKFLYFYTTIHSARLLRINRLEVISKSHLKPNGCVAGLR
jgi:hypothetical protein